MTAAERDVYESLLSWLLICKRTSCYGLQSRYAWESEMPRLQLETHIWELTGIKQPWHLHMRELTGIEQHWCLHIRELTGIKQHWCLHISELTGIKQPWCLPFLYAPRWHTAVETLCKRYKCHDCSWKRHRQESLLPAADILVVIHFVTGTIGRQIIVYNDSGFL